MSDLLSIDEELVLLRAENARLRAAQQEQGPVRVLAPETCAVLPMRVEMKGLLEAVMGKWPRDFVHVEFDVFAAAFRALATIHRQENLDSSHSPGHWVALANSRHGQGATSYWPFLAAVLAWGDIAVTDWRLKDEGVPLEFALNEFVGRLPRDEWRRTLRGDYFATPVDPRPKQHKGSPQPSILIDGRKLPDPMRYQGPRYWNEF